MGDALHPIHFGGADFLLDGRRALLWPKHRTLIVSDLHLGKGHSFAVHGHLLPPYDALETLAHLHAMIRTLKPVCVIALGDSFHRARSLSELSPSERVALEDCLDLAPQWWWILGNHDPMPPAGLRGHVAQQWVQDGIVFQHELSAPDIMQSAPHVIGHFHPKSRVPVHRKRVDYPCFTWNERLLILPAFGSFTGGLKIKEPVLQRLMGPQAHVACTSKDGALIRLPPSPRD